MTSAAEGYTKQHQILYVINTQNLTQRIIKKVKMQILTIERISHLRNQNHLLAWFNREPCAVGGQFN